jgi:hypothetical protein
MTLKCAMEMSGSELSQRTALERRFSREIVRPGEDQSVSKAGSAVHLIALAGSSP